MAVEMTPALPLPLPLLEARLPSAPGGASSAGGTEPGGDDGARRAARDLEAVFLRLLLERLVPEEGGGLFGGGTAAGVVRSLFVTGVGEKLAERRSLGIADLVEKSLARGPAGAGRAGAGVELDLRG